MVLVCVVLLFFKLKTLILFQSVIFCNTRRKVDFLTEKMHARDFTVSAMHGDMDQKVGSQHLFIPVESSSIQGRGGGGWNMVQNYVVEN